MKKTVSLISLTFLMMSFFSCGNKSAETQSQVDSLKAALEQRDADYQQLDEFLTVISSGLDSISRQESDIYNMGKESPAISREQIKEDLNRFQTTLKQQRERIAQLERKLNASSGEGQKMKAIIASLKLQLTEKESQIAELQSQLNDKNFTIQDLSQRMGVMSKRITMQEEAIAAKDDMMQQQDAVINEGFYKIGTKSELRDAGLLTGGFLKKNKVDYSNVDKNQFRSIDIRQVTEISINSKTPKILTQVPEDSYELVTNGNKSVLHILNIEKFWSVSKFLIIQI